MLCAVAIGARFYLHAEASGRGGEQSLWEEAGVDPTTALHVVDLVCFSVAGACLLGAAVIGGMLLARR